MNRNINQTWRIGSVFGIPVDLDVSYIFSILLWFLFLGQSSQPNLAISGWLMMPALFASVLLHEIGHGLAAIHHNISVDAIVLHAEGGFTRLRGGYKTPTQLLQVCFAGPLVNLTLYVTFSLIAYPLSSVGGLLPLVFNQLRDLNLFLGLFNLVPVLPLDGGQILQALLWLQTGKPTEGARYAALAGYTIGITAIIGGICFYTQKPFLGICLLYLGIHACSNNPVNQLRSGSYSPVGNSTSRGSLKQVHRSCPRRF